MNDMNEKREVKKIILTPRPGLTGGDRNENREGDSRPRRSFSERGSYSNNSDRGGYKSYPRDPNRERNFNREGADQADRGFSRERNFNRDSNFNRDPNRDYNRSYNRDPNRDYNRSYNRDPNRDGARDFNRDYNRDPNREPRERNFNREGADRPERNYPRGDRDFNRDYNRNPNYKPSWGERSSDTRNPDKPRRKRITAPGGGSYERIEPGRGPVRSGQGPGPRQEKNLSIRKNAPAKRAPIPEYPEVVFDKPLRLNKYISNTGLCSRREADEHIQAGKISVNGTVITELGVKVNPEDEVAFDGKVLNRERKIYLILNKPKGFVTTLDDPASRKTVMDLVHTACKERIYPVGRLDKLTTGVLLFTNDGELALKLTHPANHMRKVYHVHLDKPLAQEDMDKLSGGVELEDGMITPDAVDYATDDDQSQVGVEIHSGRNRIVRRMFEQIGYKVMKLDRVYFSGLSKKGLKRGKWRFLTPQEVSFLKMMPTGAS